jgi:hypothetical protein
MTKLINRFGAAAIVLLSFSKMSEALTNPTDIATYIQGKFGNLIDRQCPGPTTVSPKDWQNAPH